MNTQRFAPLLLFLTLGGGMLLAACENGGDGGSASTTPAATDASASNADGSQNSDGQLDTVSTNGERLTTEEIVEKLRPSVVQVATEGFAEDFFGNSQPQQGIGTGVIIDDEGHVVTNAHVVGDSTRITVTLDGDRTEPATVVGTDPQTDLAVLKIDATPLQPAELGDTESLPVGAEVVAIGYALNLDGEPTVTRGVVSAKGRVIQEETTVINDSIQTDASINPGNSGGPLVDDQGRVVGINTAIYQGAEGIGFAISIDLVKPIVEELLSNGQVTRGYLGIRTQDVSAGIAESLDLPVEEGVAVVSVEPGSPADDAGLQAQDVIVGIEDAGVTNSGELLEALRQYSAGDTVTVRLYRSGDQMNVDVTLAERPASLN
jgi:S1-C subfamily serine protease